ncbi:group III truncated hemoglobin [Ginsengibacter hankyongi]|uniref:Group III truncated hemoglobin n=1 Tax=Ginsengibacter hankyongi TaxID=2607284 RepID=A0A5J5IE94_9BACT|nr:group III truncated hemoglobin [Ginsengibacter hankyongi]KAA9037168.1 group III truncated hemoglobin [Ginsengibacter hankyongi]
MNSTRIASLDDIKRLVDTFYEKVRKDELIGPIFDDRIHDRWPQHLEKMYTFWQTVLLGEHTYYGSPFPPHAGLPVSHIHFEKWMELFIQTVDELFIGEIAEDAKWRAGKMAELFESKIKYYTGNPFKSLL